MGSEDVGWRRIDPADTRGMIGPAAEEMGSIVRRTLGPLGLDSMIVRPQSGEIRAMVTNDAVALIEELEGESTHPVANRFIYLSRSHEEAYGDGATRTLLLASELITTGISLIEDGIHPQDVIEGFMIGGQRTIERWEQQAIDLRSPSGALDRDRLESIALSGMVNGRPGSWELSAVADDVVNAVLRVSDAERGTVDLKSIDTVTIPGEGVHTSTLLDGLVLPQTPVVAERLLPLSGGLLLVSGDLSISTPFGMDVSVKGDAWASGEFSPAQVGANAEVAEHIARAGVRTVVASGDVSYDMAEELAAHGIVCFRNTTDVRMRRLSRITGARIHGGTPADGTIARDHIAGVETEQRRIGDDDEWVEISSTGQYVPTGGTIVVRGGTERSAEEAERRIKQGMNTLRAAIGRQEALPAGGASETGAAVEIREFSRRFDGREQLAIAAFADVLESVPRTLAANAGHDPIDALTRLRAAHEAGHARAGIAATGDIVDDVTASGGIEPFLIQTSALVKAIDFAAALLRIDGILVSDDTGSLS